MFNKQDYLRVFTIIWFAFLVVMKCRKTIYDFYSDGVVYETILQLVVFVILSIVLLVAIIGIFKRTKIGFYMTIGANIFFIIGGLIGIFTVVIIFEYPAIYLADPLLWTSVIQLILGVFLISMWVKNKKYIIESKT